MQMRVEDTPATMLFAAFGVFEMWQVAGDRNRRFGSKQRQSGFRLDR
jgi:hypothetical protein